MFKDKLKGAYLVNENHSFWSPKILQSHCFNELTAIYKNWFPYYFLMGGGRINETPPFSESLLQ